MSKAARTSTKSKSVSSAKLTAQDLEIFAKFTGPSMAISARTRRKQPTPPTTLPEGVKFLTDPVPPAPRSLKYMRSSKKVKDDAAAALAAASISQKATEAIESAQRQKERTKRQQAAKLAQEKARGKRRRAKAAGIALNAVQNAAIVPKKTNIAVKKEIVSPSDSVDISQAKSSTTTSKTNSTSNSSTHTATSNKKRPREDISKSPSPSIIVAPPVQRKENVATQKKTSSKPYKKKQKLSEPTSEAEEFSEDSPHQSRASVPPEVVLPDTLKCSKDGVYEWREWDTEEARLYEFCRVWNSQPSHTEAWRNQGDTRAEERERTYGEVTLPGMMALFEELKFQKEDVFVDIGSGLGNLVFYASFVKGAKKSYGIEIQRNRHVAAEEIRDDLALLRKPYWDPSSCEFVWTQSFDVNECPGVDQILGNATIVFVNNILFSANSNDQCIQALNNIALNVRAVVFTSPPAPRASKRAREMEKNPFRLWKSIEVKEACSWCSAPLKYYIYKPFFLTTDEEKPLNHFRYPDLPLTATTWTLDPKDGIIDPDTTHINALKKAADAQGKTKSPPKVSRFVTQQSRILVSEASRMHFKTIRRAGIAPEGIKTKVRDANLSGFDILAEEACKALTPPPTNGRRVHPANPNAKMTAAGVPVNSKIGIYPISSVAVRTSNSRVPKTITNLNGDKIAFLVPEMAPGMEPYHHVIFNALNLARFHANRQ